MIACQNKCWLRSNCGNVAFFLNPFELNESRAKLRNEFLCNAGSAASRVLWICHFPVLSIPALVSAELSGSGQGSAAAAVGFMLCMALKGISGI